MSKCAMPLKYEPVITDHAMLRWLERVAGIDMDEVRAAILADGRAEWVANGASQIRVPSLNITVVAKGGKVITIIPTSRSRVTLVTE